jgi:trigger factor
MSKIVESKVVDKVNYELYYKVSKDEYSIWAQRLRNQYYQTIEIPGFRKGKAPINLIEETIDKKALEQTLIRESLQKYTSDALQEAQKDLETKKLTPIMSTFGVKDDSIKTEDGFEFVLIAQLLPEIDFEFLKDIKTDRVGADKLENRLSKQEFIEKEKLGFITSHNKYSQKKSGKSDNLDKVILDMTGKIDGETDPKLTAQNMECVLGSGNFLPDFESSLVGLSTGDKKTFDVVFPENYFEQSIAGKTATFSVEINSVNTPEFTKVDQVLKQTDHSEHNHDQFEDEKSFDKYVAEYYDKETEKLIEDRWQKSVLAKVAELNKKLPVNERNLTIETDRIFNALLDDAKAQKTTLPQLFATSGIPGSDKKITDEIKIKSVIEDYVRDEFVLVSIWNVIYEKEAGEKISKEQLDLATKEVKQNPTRFGLPQDAADDLITEYTANVLKKQIAATWLFNKLDSK